MAQLIALTIICPGCGGDPFGVLARNDIGALELTTTRTKDGCDDCDSLGVVDIEGSPRADGLPWHPHAVEGPTHIVAPPPSVRRRRSGPGEDAAAIVERERAELERLRREREGIVAPPALTDDERAELERLRALASAPTLLG